MLIGLSFSLRFPEPCLNTIITLANLEGAGIFDEPIHCIKVSECKLLLVLIFPDLTTIWTLILTVIALSISKHVYSVK